VYEVPAGQAGAGNLLVVYHAELENPPNYYSLLGLAVSRDHGRSWTDLGEIIRPNYPNSKNLPRGFDIGDSRLELSPDGKYFYIHFQDWIQATGAVTQLSVARAEVAAVLRAAFDSEVHRAARFSKYYNGVWEQPGIGGISTDLNPNATFSGDPQVVWNSHLQRYVMISDDSQNFAYAESADGLSWTNTTLLGTFGHYPNLSAYGTPVGKGEDPNVLGQEFYVFYKHFQQGKSGPPIGSLWRFTISCP
jgi:hypothetical protein